MSTVAIDISDTIIRLVVLNHRRNRWRLPIRAEIPVPAGNIVDGDIKQPNEVSRLLKSLVGATGVHIKDAYIFLPERHTFVKMISLPADSPSKLEQAVPESLTQHIPYPINEVYWDWFATPKKNSLGQRQVLVGVAPRVTVDTYLHVLADAGLNVVVADIESVSITRAMFGPTPPADTRIILDLGRTRSTLILVNNGVVQFTSTLRYAGRELNRYIADELHLDYRQAERAKSLFGLDPKRGKGLLRAVLIPHLDAIASSISEVEDFYQEHFVDHQPISQIQVTGSGALLRNLDVELQTRLSQPVLVAPSWIYNQLIETDSSLPKELGYTHTSVFGLAMTVI